MRVTNVSYTRVLSDRCYGNRQASVHLEVHEGDDPAGCLAEARRLCEQAVYTPRLLVAPPDDDYIDDDDEDQEEGDYEDGGDYDEDSDESGREPLLDPAEEGNTP